MSLCTHSSRMSSIGLSNTDNSVRSRRAHRRHDSGELDVFEAVRYFAGAMDEVGLAGRIGPQRVIREDRVLWREERKSLDTPMTTIPPQACQGVEKYHSKERKCKQPSSPGTRLASFLNSIFNQTGSKRKSKSCTTAKSSKDGELEERPGGRSRRRSCHSRSTPPPHTSIPAKSQEEQCRSYKLAHGQPKVATFCPQREVWDERRVQGETWLAEIAKFSDRLHDKSKVLGGGKLDVAWNEGLLENRWVLHRNKEGFFEKHGECGDEFRRKEESMEDNGGETDSSSDLFELKNIEFGEFSSGLPFYGTTEMEIVERGSSITSVPF
ncbi:protein BIG GRAIN 1-like E [Phoenix dactylifera]|uniref:Protein BIG GRAIN 1-like E n=1 Tax=Phoenix dactylifera TaxID=42345 RepID=A0A8B9AB32_PHODC|nr:protein BIG GRAIN 1-like E [Phoenix dactylifera]